MPCPGMLREAGRIPGSRATWVAGPGAELPGDQVLRVCPPVPPAPALYTFLAGRPLCPARLTLVFHESVKSPLGNLAGPPPWPQPSPAGEPQLQQRLTLCPCSHPVSTSPRASPGLSLPVLYQDPLCHDLAARPPEPQCGEVRSTCSPPSIPATVLLFRPLQPSLQSARQEPAGLISLPLALILVTSHLLLLPPCRWL